VKKNNKKERKENYHFQLGEEHESHNGTNNKV
jgi:hypothetical protein